ncbi:tfiih basal transcription factor complex helicase subunit [Echinococcus multilocularis]|uniref:Tfiih basal transcription factor complex helicase subunit n=1 Tax=Echinococcus multilocularis TaxID=6211 RepID=A0A0S4MJJ8_ECHMU|nr:tfiih basal transcription factor complex helicase subunit [Echinococcus multilocularis]
MYSLPHNQDARFNSGLRRGRTPQEAKAALLLFTHNLLLTPGIPRHGKWNDTPGILYNTMAWTRTPWILSPDIFFGNHASVCFRLFYCMQSHRGSIFFAVTRLLFAY